YILNLFISLGTADGHSLAYLNGLVGHHGWNGCCLYCGMPGCLKMNGHTYYPVLSGPLDYNIPRSDHDDIDPETYGGCCSPGIYFSKLI
ncbi:hypothetical protein PAXRUDRAFT_141523, partial [Paxillus rubicundulus Ve08.2h10]